MALAGDRVVVKLDDSSGTLRTFANGDITSVDLGLTTDQYDVSGFGDGAHHVINGQLKAPVTLRGYVTTTATTGTHTVLKGAFAAGTQVTLKVDVGNNTAPVTGDPEYSGEFYIASYVPVIDSSRAVTFTATLSPALGTPPSWGTMP